MCLTGLGSDRPREDWPGGVANPGVVGDDDAPSSLPRRARLPNRDRNLPKPLPEGERRGPDVEDGAASPSPRPPSADRDVSCSLLRRVSDVGRRNEDGGTKSGWLGEEPRPKIFIPVETGGESRGGCGDRRRLGVLSRLGEFNKERVDCDLIDCSAGRGAGTSVPGAASGAGTNVPGTSCAGTKVAGTSSAGTRVPGTWEGAEAKVPGFSGCDGFRDGAMVGVEEPRAIAGKPELLPLLLLDKGGRRGKCPPSASGEREWLGLRIADECEA